MYSASASTESTGSAKSLRFAQAISAAGEIGALEVDVQLDLRVGPGRCASSGVTARDATSVPRARDVWRTPPAAKTPGVPRSRPLIAVTSSEMRDPPAHLAKAEADPRQREMALGLRYLEALAGAGALPMVVPPLPPEALDDLLDTVDGVLFSGGPDIDPSAYGQEPTPCLGPTEPELDAFELTLAMAADHRDTPILAICRGSQLVNVSRGGTLHQHLPDIVGTDIQHRQRERVRGADACRVAVEPDSRLAAIARLGRRLGQLASIIRRSTRSARACA